MITLVSSNSPRLEHNFMVPKVFEPLKFYCILYIQSFRVFIVVLFYRTATKTKRSSLSMLLIGFPPSMVPLIASLTASSVAIMGCSYHFSPLSLLKICTSRSLSLSDAKCGTSMMIGLKRQQQNLVNFLAKRNMKLCTDTNVSGWVGGWVDGWMSGWIHKVFNSICHIHKLGGCL